MFNMLNALLNHYFFVPLLDISYIFLCNYFLSLQLLLLNCKDVQKLRCLAFAAITTAFVVFPNYLYLLHWDWFFTPESLPVVTKWMTFILFYRNPVWMAICLFSACKLLGLSRQNIAGVSLMIFCYCQLFELCSNAFEPLAILLRPMLAVYTVYALSHFFLIGLLLFCNWWLARYISRNTHRIKTFFESRKDPRFMPGAVNYILIFFFWLILASAHFFLAFSLTGVKVYYYPVMIIFISTVIVFSFHLKLKDVEIANLGLYNHALSTDLDQLRGLKHDINNLLQVYEGFIKIKSYDLLEAYHDELFDSNVKSNEQLNFHLVLKGRPALYGEFLTMSRGAIKAGVDFQTNNIKELIHIDIPDLDLCRILSVLLGNAIEHAAKTPQKKVLVSVNAHSKAESIIVVSNAILEAVDVSNIFAKGYTTKEGHMGIGLYEINRIIAKYYGCTITPHCTETLFTMYLRAPIKRRGNNQASSA